MEDGTNLSYSTSDNSSDSFVQINEEDVDINPPTAELQGLKHELHSREEEWEIKAESEFNLQLYAAGRAATVGVLGPSQCGKTTLVTHLSKRAISSANASASMALNQGLRRTVFTEAWRSHCKISRNNASPNHIIFFLDTPGHPQQLPESISICCRLRTVILVVNLCAGLQFDHSMYLSALEERLTASCKRSHSWLPPTCILAFSNVDKFCYEENRRLRRRNGNQCCPVQYLALQLRLQARLIEAALCREYPWLRGSLSPQVMLCYYNCTKEYYLENIQRTLDNSIDALIPFERIVDSLLNGTRSAHKDLILHIPKSVPGEVLTTVSSEHLRALFLCSCPYEISVPWSVYFYYTPLALEGSESNWKQVLGSSAFGPLIEESDGSLKRLTIIPADTIFAVLASPQYKHEEGGWIDGLNQRSTFYPYLTHIQLPIALVFDVLQLSVYFSGLDIQPTQQVNVLEVRTRGEYVLNLFLSICHLLAQKFLAQKVPKHGDSAIRTLPLLPVLKKCISHASQKPTQLKVYLDESRGIINLIISILLREAHPPKAWGYKTGLQKRAELLATLDPRASVYDQVATLYANESFSIVDGTMQCDAASTSDGSIVLSSQLTHSAALVEALREAIAKEAESSSVPFHNLQVVVLGCECYQKTHYLHLHASTLFTNAIERSRLRYLDPLLYVQLFLNKELYRTKRERNYLSSALDKLKSLLCMRRCIFTSDPWIQTTCPLSSLAVTSFYIPAGSALGLDMAIEHVLRCTSVNIYHSEQIYFTRTINAILDTADRNGTVDATKNRFSAFNMRL